SLHAVISNTRAIPVAAGAYLRPSTRRRGEAAGMTWWALPGTSVDAVMHPHPHHILLFSDYAKLERRGCGFPAPAPGRARWGAPLPWGGAHRFPPSGLTCRAGAGNAP